MERNTGDRGSADGQCFLSPAYTFSELLQRDDSIGIWVWELQQSFKHKFN